jgi:hypothetical protein
MKGNVLRMELNPVITIPKGLNHPAQRCRASGYAGYSSKKFINPERVVSIPNIPLIKFNLVAFQKFPELVLKRNLAMMLLLPNDVIPYRLHL